MTVCTRVIRKDKYKNSIVFEKDPGRRNHSLFGARHMRHILRMHFISEDLILALFGQSHSDFYWMLMTLNGKLVELS